MPKVVSRSIVCTDHKANARDESALTVYYCWCGSIGLVLDCKIYKLPLRKRDGSRVIDTKKHVYKLSCVETTGEAKAGTLQLQMMKEEIVYVKWREHEIEKQHRLKCKKCNLWCFYRNSSDSNVIFIVKQAMNEAPRNPLLATKMAAGVKDAPTPQASSSGQRAGASSSTGRFANVTISTMEEEEAEAEAKEIASSYEQNAALVQRKLEQQREMQKRARYDQGI